MPNGMAKGSSAKSGKGNARGAKKRKRRGPGGVRELEIVDAAIDIFHDHGYAATSVDDIAEAVNLLKGSLYYYIDTKEDLLLRIVEDVHAEVEALLKESIRDTSRPPLERFADYIRAQVEYNARNIKRVRVYYHDYEQLSDERLEEVRRRRRADEQAVVGLLREAKKAKEVSKDLDERLAARAVFATIIWMYTWFKPGGGVSGKEFGEFCADFVLNGLRGLAPPSPDKPRRKGRAKSA
jgi:AcrR family transcriptional regulator